MAKLSPEPDVTLGQSPLSYTQELWVSGDQGDDTGFFSLRFVMAAALRITGRIDVEALRGALDQVVGRHEILRTVVVRQAERPYQRIHPPCPVPLRVMDLPDARGSSRDAVAEELLNEAERETVDPAEVPVLRAALHRFDESDSVLTLVIHHTACDEWSIQVILRDLAACYAAWTVGQSPDLPRARQYREFVTWQRSAATSPDTGQARAYWQEKMRGARIFAVPTSRPVPETHVRPYSAYHFVIDSAASAAAARLARAENTTVATTVLAALNVLVHRIAGTTDQALDTLTTGRGESEFVNTVGSLMNFLVFRTDLGTCTSFRQVIARTRDVCLEAYSHEVPIRHIERYVPELMEPNEDAWKTNCIFGIFEAPFTDNALRIADSSQEIRTSAKLVPAGAWIPHGVAWNTFVLTSGAVRGSVQFNSEDLDERTVGGWVAMYQRILSAGAAEPDRHWKTL